MYRNTGDGAAHNISRTIHAILAFGAKCVAKLREGIAVVVDTDARRIDGLAGEPLAYPDGC